MLRPDLPRIKPPLTRRLLSQPLTPEERLTLEELAKRHRFGDFRRRALGLLALDSGSRVVDICRMLQVSTNPYTTGPKPGESRGSWAFWMVTKAGLPSS